MLAYWDLKCCYHLMLLSFVKHVWERQHSFSWCSSFMRSWASKSTAREWAPSVSALSLVIIITSWIWHLKMCKWVETYLLQRWKAGQNSLLSSDCWTFARCVSARRLSCRCPEEKDKAKSLSHTSVFLSVIWWCCKMWVKCLSAYRDKEDAPKQCAG